MYLQDFAEGYTLDQFWDAQISVVKRISFFGVMAMVAKDLLKTKRLKLLEKLRDLKSVK